MKILFFLSSHKIGLTNLLSEQAIFLNVLDTLDFNFIAGEKEQETGLTQYLESHKIECYRLNGLDDHKGFFKLVADFKEYINTVQPDIVHVQTNWQLVISVFTKLFVKKKYKVLYTIHGFRHNDRYKSKVALLIIQLLLGMFSTQVYAASSIVYKKFNLIKNKIKILFLGVEEKFFTFDVAATSENIQQIKMIFPGAFREGKNQSSLVHIVSNYIHMTGDRSIRLSLPGSGPLKKSCIDLAKELQISDNIVFPGQLSKEEMVDAYRNSNIAVVPTNFETFGHCIAEPFVLGLCVVSRKTGVAVDIIKENENGYLFETDDELLKILAYLHKNPLKIKEYGESAFKEREKFRWKNIVKHYKEFILALDK